MNNIVFMTVLIDNGISLQCWNGFPGGASPEDY